MMCGERLCEPAGGEFALKRARSVYAKRLWAVRLMTCGERLCEPAGGEFALKRARSVYANRAGGSSP